MKKKNRRILFIILLLACATGASVWWYASNSKDNGPAAPATARVVRKDFSSTVLATGAVKSKVGSEVKVGARVSGKVLRLYANIGDAVKKGQVIAELEKEDLEAKVNQRTAELEMAEAKLAAIKSLRPREIEKAETDVNQWQATVDLNRMDFARQDELLKQDLTSPQAYDQAKEQLAVSETRLASVRKALELAKTGYKEDLRQAAAAVEGAKAALANDKVQLAYSTITAPISGVIASVSTQEGETVAAGLNAPVFVTIVDLKRLQVDAFVDEVDIGKVHEGQKVVFTVDSYSAREFEGKVAAIYPKAVIQENVVNYDVVIDITSSYDGLLKPDMTASVTIMLEARPNVLAVPVEAVKRERGKTLLYILTDGRAEPREVKTGWKDGPWIEIAGGVKEGETVFLEAPASPTESDVRR